MRRRLIALFTSVTLLMTMIIASSVVTVSAASPEYDIPSKIVIYYNASDDDEPDWEVDYKVPLLYDTKGNISKIGKYKVKWNYSKSGKPVTATTGSKKQRIRSVATYKKGKLKTDVFKEYNKKGKVTHKSTATFSYNKKGWISKRTEKCGKNSFTLSYKYSFYSNGMLKKMTNKHKSNGKTSTSYTYFNDKGLVTKYESKYEKEKFKYKYDEQGRPIECIIKYKGEPITKLVFTYNGVKTKNKKLYMGLINYLSIVRAAQDVVPSEFGFYA